MRLFEQRFNFLPYLLNRHVVDAGERRPLRYLEFTHPPALVARHIRRRVARLSLANEFLGIGEKSPKMPAADNGYAWYGKSNSQMRRAGIVCQNERCAPDERNKLEEGGLACQVDYCVAELLDELIAQSLLGRTAADHDRYAKCIAKSPDDLNVSSCRPVSPKVVAAGGNDYIRLRWNLEISLVGGRDKPRRMK